MNSKFRFLFLSGLTSLALISCLITTSHAQRSPNSRKQKSTPIGERVKIGNTEQIGEFEQNLIFALELNTDQAEKFMAVNEQYRDVMNKLKSSPDFNTAEKREYYQALLDEQNKEMKAFMTKAQYNEYLSLTQYSTKPSPRNNANTGNVDNAPYNNVKVGERVKMGNAEQIGEFEQNLIFALELNTDQAEKFMAVNEQYRDVMNKLKSSPDFNTAEKREYYQALLDEQNKEMKAFMTKAQYNQYLSLTQYSTKPSPRNNANTGNVDNAPYNNVKVGERVKMGNAEQIGEFEQDIIFALELNTDQAEKFMAVNEQYRDVMNKLKSSPDFNTAEKREYYQALRDEQNKEMKAFMTKAQYNEYLSLTAEF